MNYIKRLGQLVMMGKCNLDEDVHNKELLKTIYEGFLVGEVVDIDFDENLSAVEFMSNEEEPFIIMLPDDWLINYSLIVG